MEVILTFAGFLLLANTGCLGLLLLSNC